MVRVKICGITNWADAKLALDLGADALGFNFYPASPRYLNPAAAGRLVRRIPQDVQAVGVFVNGDFFDVDKVAQTVALTAVQLHGDESPEVVEECAEIWPVIKAFRVAPSFRPSRLARYPRASAFLLDGFRPGARGGTGKTFDWSVARRAARYGRIILAGGLKPENVAEAIRAVRPWMIDVCSGVEASPGRKNPARLRALMREVAAASKALEG